MLGCDVSQKTVQVIIGRVLTDEHGRQFSFTQVPTEGFATLFPDAAEIAATWAYFQAQTYLGSDSSDRIALANTIAGVQPTPFSTWARVNLPARPA